MEAKKQTASSAVVTVAAILLPGLGYWLLGQPKRAILTGGGVLALFILGILFGGIRVIGVPGFDEGYLKYLEPPTTQPIIDYRQGNSSMGEPRYVLTRRTPQGTREEQTNRRPELQLFVAPVAAIGDNLWFLGQMLVGPVCGAAAYVSIHVAQLGVGRSYGRLADIGSLYTAVAGMLNLLVIIDCYARATPPAKGGRR